jgi:hypothetical protein
MIAMTVERRLTGWVDEDRPHLVWLSPAEKIDYFEQRVGMVLVRPVDAMYHETDIILGRPDTSGLLVVNTAIICAVEACGRFFLGHVGPAKKGENWERFDGFVGRYMNAGFKKTLRQKTYTGHVWTNFRNGLAHGFAVCRGGFEQHMPGDAYFDVRDGRLVIDPHQLWADVKQAIARYLDDLRAAGPGDKIVVNFLKVFDAVFVRGE